MYTCVRKIIMGYAQVNIYDDVRKVETTLSVIAFCTRELCIVSLVQSIL